MIIPRKWFAYRKYAKTSVRWQYFHRITVCLITYRSLLGVCACHTKWQIPISPNVAFAKQNQTPDIPKAMKTVYETIYEDKLRVLVPENSLWRRFIKTFLQHSFSESLMTVEDGRHVMTDFRWAVFYDNLSWLLLHRTAYCTRNLWHQKLKVFTPTNFFTKNLQLKTLTPKNCFTANIFTANTFCSRNPSKNNNVYTKHLDPKIITPNIFHTQNFYIKELSLQKLFKPNNIVLHLSSFVYIRQCWH